MGAGLGADSIEKGKLASYIDALEPILRDELPAGVAWAETGPRKAQRARAGSRAKQRR